MGRDEAAKEPRAQEEKRDCAVVGYGDWPMTTWGQGADQCNLTRWTALPDRRNGSIDREERL